MAFDVNSFYSNILQQSGNIGTSTNTTSTSSYTSTSPGANEQLAIVAKDAALQAAVLQAQAQLQLTNQQAQISDVNALFTQQNLGFTQDFLRNQARSVSTQGKQQLGSVRAGTAASGLKLSGTALDVYRDEQRKVNKNLENVNREGYNQLSSVQNQLTNLRLQSAQLRESGQIEAQLGLRLADISTHQFI